MNHVPLPRVRPDAHLDMQRAETLYSLTDGRARWPDGRLREIPVPLYDRLRQRELDRR